jgi:PAS domain S-box-containing protein
MSCNNPSVHPSAAVVSTCPKEHGVVLQLADGTIAACNDAAQGILGMTLDQLQDASSTNCPWQTIHPDGTPFPGATHPAIMTLATGKPCLGVEMGFYRPDGSLVWMNLETQPLFQRNSVAPYAVTVLLTPIATPASADASTEFETSPIAAGRELVELEATQAALQTALQQLNFHVENTPLAVVEWDHNFCVSRWSSEAERIFGWSAAEILGQGFNTWKFVFEADEEQVRQAASSLSDGSAQRVVVQNRNYTKSGEVVHCEWYNSTLTDGGGQLVSVLSLALDISDRVQAETALRESEAQYRLLTEAIPQFVFVTTTEGQNEYVNQQFCDYTGLSLEQMLNLDWLTIIHPDDRDRTRDRWLASVNSGEFYEIEYRFRRFDGTYRWFLGQGLPMRDEQGQLVKWFGTCTDIDAQKRIEAERLRLLQQEQVARQAAEQANRVKDEFLAVISHELRTPLNPILGWSKLLQKGNLETAQAKKALETIERNAKQQAQLIEDLLDVSRILRGKLTLNIAPVDLNLITAAAIETVRLAAESKSIRLRSSLDPNIGMMMGDVSRLNQILSNLLTNAVKFTSEGGQINVTLTQNRGMAQLQVSDTGKGIHPDFLPHLFEAFCQEDSTNTRQFGGLGLGLSIVRQLVELHEGTVNAQSAGEGQGATFTVCLPIADCRSSPSSLLVENEQPLDLSGVTVLVVDDMTDSREFAAFVLEESGALVTQAASAQAALKALAQMSFDVLVTDIGMPDMNGYQLMQFIRTQGTAFQNIPAIAVTAYASESDQTRVLESGFQCHVAKPVHSGALVKAVVTLSTKRS